MSATPPTTLGKYQIIREIARSNDIVYEGYDPLMNRRVAVKELAVPPGSTPQQFEDRVRRFQREVRAAGSLAHPNIVTIYEVGEESGRHFMAMEFLEGRNLRNELDTTGMLSVKRAIRIALDVLHGLDFAHQHGVVHRDVKPENIQLLPDGRVKLTDFGIARLTFEPNLTMDGQVFGTPSYMSPEQVVGRDIDARTDVFSTGVVLYEMLAGVKPFVGDSVVAITYAIMNHEPPQPAQANHTVWQIVRRALDKSPALRFASAKEMIESLEIAEANLDAVLPGAVPSAPMPTFQMPTSANVPPPLPSAYGSPYGAPYGAPMPTQSAPYGAPLPTPGAPYTHQPYAPYQPQTYQPVPVYYPPPPRPPLLKAHHKLFLAKMFFTFLLLGTVFVLVIMAISRIAEQQAPVGAAPAETSIEATTNPASTMPEQPRVVPAPRPAYDEARAEAHVETALQAMQQGDRLRARQELTTAREYARPRTPLRETIDQLLILLGG